MASPAPTNSLMLNVKELYPSGLFSDLTINCGGESFKVHKSILYLQSNYFRKLLGGKFKEANTSSLDLHDDDPAVLRVLLHYLYNFTLDDSHRPSSTRLSPFIVSVYAIADKYDVPQLRNMAAQRFRNVCDPVRDYDDFLAAVRVVDECTSEPTLWNVILPKVRDNIPLLMRNDSFRVLMMDMPAFTFQLVSFMGPEGDAALTAWQPSSNKRKSDARAIGAPGAFAADDVYDDEWDRDEDDGMHPSFPGHQGGASRGSGSYPGPGRRLG